MIGIAFIAVGGFLISYILASNYCVYEKNQSDIQEFETNQKTQIIEPYHPDVRETTPPQKRISIAEAQMIGILEIPCIQLKTAIYEGTTDEIFKKGAGHFSKTSLPFEKGNCAIAGHNGYYTSEFFKNLKKLSIGDQVIVKTEYGVFGYTVYDIKTVMPYDTKILQNTKENVLTLVTCNADGTKRLVVFCKR